MPPFTPKDWHDLPATDTPVTSAELERIEAGVAAAMATAEAAQTLAGSSVGSVNAIRLDHTNLHTIGSGAAVDWVSGVGYHSIPATGYPGLSGSVDLPDHWATYGVLLAWIDPAAAPAGTFRMRWDAAALTAGSVATVVPGLAEADLTPSAQNIVKVSTLATGLSVGSDRSVYFRVFRDQSVVGNSADPFGLLAVTLIKSS